jgi:hypothetical protein
MEYGECESDGKTDGFSGGCGECRGGGRRCSDKENKHETMTHKTRQTESK